MKTHRSQHDPTAHHSLALSPRWLHLLQEGPEGRVAWYLWKLLLAAIAAAIFAWMYFGVARLTMGRSYDFMTRLDADIPFIPWTWWIYFPGYIFGLFFATFALRDVRVFYRLLLAVLVAEVICAAIFVTVPSTFPRPDTAGGGITGAAIRWFWGVDPPNNTFPSSHVAISALAAIGMWEERNRLRLVNYLLTLGVAVTVLTTKQHYIIDMLGGLLVAVVSFWAVFRLLPVSEAGGQAAALGQQSWQLAPFGASGDVRGGHPDQLVNVGDPDAARSRSGPAGRRD